LRRRRAWGLRVQQGRARWGRGRVRLRRGRAWGLRVQQRRGRWRRVRVKGYTLTPNRNPRVEER